MQDRKNELQKALGLTVKDYRKNLSINRLSLEVDLSKSIWSELEKGKKIFNYLLFGKLQKL